jgi:raffinose/stachyose/melibiose transport system substrate-binding protein
MKKRIITPVIGILCIMLIVSFALAGCKTTTTAETTAAAETKAAETMDTKTTGDDSEPVTLSLIHNYDPDTGGAMPEVYVAAINKFQESNPSIKLEVEYIPHDEYLPKIKTMAAADALPDMMFADGSMVLNFTDNNLLLPLNEILNDPENIEWYNGFPKSAFNEFIIKENIYGIPLQLFATHIIFYNKEIFAECGFSEFPKDWDSLLTAADAIKSKGYIPMALGNKGLWPIESFANTLVDRFTGTEWMFDIINRTGNAKFTDPEFVLFLQTMQELAEGGFFNDDAQSAEYSLEYQLYGNKKAAMICQGQWGLSTFITNVPEELVNNTGLAILPGGVPNQKGKDNTVSGGAGWAMSLNKKMDDAQLQAAIKFLKAWWTQETTNEALVKGGTPSYSVDLTKVEIEGFPKLYWELIQDYEFSPIYGTTLVPSLKDIYQRGLQELMIGESSPEDIASSLQAEQERLMKESQ